MFNNVYVHLNNMLSPDSNNMLDLKLNKKIPRFWNIMVADIQSPILLGYNIPVEPVLQNGPKCGIVALAMAAQMLQCPTMCAEEIFERALAKGFTSQGEMFSAPNMAALAQDVFPCQAKVLHGPLDLTATVVHHLMQRGPVLFPYDADANHEPCNRGGHAAHWALLTGFCLVLDGETPPESDATQDSNLGELYLFNTSSPQTVDRYLHRARRIFVCACQGKSRHTALWDWGALCASNRNLEAINPKHLAHNFVVEADGSLGGLRDQMVMVTSL